MEAAELALKALQLASALTSFLKQISGNPDALQAIVDKARAEGREIGADDVRKAVEGMHAAGADLDALIAAKR